ncbi:hypothetical protein HKCCE2091_16725 [Rhodobacterales bacterium HKCCE2091]|nr:hypothetical protein [Rhodobacterales bacterium HKCCE2091]
MFGTTMKRACFGLALPAAALGGAAWAQDFPERGVDVVLHAGSGGGTDITTRQVLPGASEAFGQGFEILPKQGGNGIVALSYMETVEPDGYTVMTLTASHLAAIARGETEFTMDDITCLARMTDDPQYLMTAAGRYESAEAMIEDVTSRPVRIGGAEIGGTDHIAVASFARRLGEGFDYTYVPFDAAPATGAALVNGDIDFATINYSEARSMIDAGRIEPVLVLAADRQEALPDVPTAREVGIESIFSSLRAIATLSAVPEDRQALLSDAFLAGMETEAYTTYLADIGLPPSTIGDADACNEQLSSMYTDTADALEAIGFIE